MRKLLIVALVMTLAGFAAAASSDAKASRGGTQLTSEDLCAADGSCRVGRHNGSMFCILTATKTDVTLTPDSWSSEDESKNWDKWLVDFDDSLYTRWLDSAPGAGQETVRVRIDPAHLTVTNGRFLNAAASDEGQRKFEATLKQCLQQTLKAAPPVPVTKNPLKEVRLALTFMCDPVVVPRFGKREFGFAAVVVPPANSVNVYGRLKDGRSPGIQIIGDGPAGDIEVTDADAFQRRCQEIDGQAR